MFTRTFRLFRNAKQNILLLWHACRHPATPRAVKAGAVLLALYLLSPVDLIPDWLIGLGITDDVAVLAIGIPLLLRFVPSHVLRDARSSSGRIFRMRR